MAGETNVEVGETLLPQHEHEYDSDHEDEKHGQESDYHDGRRNSLKGSFWIFLATTATLTTRRILRDRFPYPFYFVLLLQLAAYGSAAVTVLLLQIKKLGVASFSKAKRKASDQKGKHGLVETLIIGVRLFISACFGAFAGLFATKALMLYDNICVLAMLPILTYVSDSLLFRFLHICRITRQRDMDIEWWPFWKVILIPLCIALAVFEDYRLNIDALTYALASFGLMSCARAISRVGPRIEKSTTWETSLYVSLWVGIPFLIITTLAATKYEDLVAASHITQTWTSGRYFLYLMPGVHLHVFFASPVYSSYPFVSQDLAGGALEDPTHQSRAAIRSTLHTGLWVMFIGMYGKEQNLVDWLQVIAFTIIYVVSVGPKHIGYYPPRFANLIARIARRKPQPVHSEPWQFSLVLVFTTTVFAVLLSTNLMYWVDTASYNRNLKTWLDPKVITVDAMYRSPQLRSFDIIIAHSQNDSIDSITELIDAFTSIPSVRGFGPRVIVYSKDASLATLQPDSIKGTFEGSISIQSLRNSGGVPATFLHHILYAWEFLSQQTLFLSTSSQFPLSQTRARMNEYFMSAGFPIPDAQPKTGFLNLGDQASCWCGSCSDSLGWEDTFHLVPSMWGAARPGSSKCESVLITRGNEFVASAARIRGLKRDVWQMLFDALTKEDVGNAWAHDAAKLPKMNEGEKKMGKWAADGVYGVPDSLAAPVLASTIERLWAVLLQCSSPEIAWRCPSLYRESRMGGERADCECID